MIKKMVSHPARHRDKHLPKNNPIQVDGLALYDKYKVQG